MQKTTFLKMKYWTLIEGMYDAKANIPNEMIDWFLLLWKQHFRVCTIFVVGILTIS